MSTTFKMIPALILALVFGSTTKLEAANPGGYGAISYSNKSGTYGISIGLNSLAEANDMAKRNNNGLNPRIILWGQNEWIAVAEGSNGTWGTGVGTTKAKAKELALANCESYGGKNCKIVVNIYTGK